jgi:MFS family permease
MSERPSPATAVMASVATEQVGWRFIVVYALAFTGFWLAVLTPLVVTLALRVQAIDPANATARLSLVVGVGALLALLGNPLFGQLSDRTTSRFGMRRPWLVGGALVGTAGLAIVAAAANIAMVLLGWCVAQLGFNALLAAITAILPDQVAPRQRGTVSGVLGICLPLGQIGGTYLVQALSGSTVLMFLAPAMVGAAAVMVLAITLPDRHLHDGDRPAFGLGDLARTLWVSPRRHPDFAWAWASRFLLVLSLTLVVTYQAFYLGRQLGYRPDDVPRLIFLASLTQAPVVVISSLLGGRLSDLLGRRKLLVLASATVFALGMVVIALARSFPQFLTGLAITGVGQGANLAVGLALVADVLPNDQTGAAKDLGVFNIANTMPQSLAPAIAPAILAIGGGYTSLFLAGGVFAVAAAICIQPVRGVR